jgi:AcrR family transcriptional regulator
MELSNVSNVADRIAQQTLSARGEAYSTEVGKLLDAGREVMRRGGTTSRPRVADIVAAAGLSNDAFYRHFASKDLLVAAILEDGTERLRSYLDHRMAKASTPADAIRLWIEGVLSQAADEEAAATTVAVLWNAGNMAESLAAPPTALSAALASLLHEPVGALGSDDPERDATLVAHATVGRLSDLLWARTRPTKADVTHTVRFCLAAVERPA